jgi:hypothetical protein
MGGARSGPSRELLTALRYWAAALAQTGRIEAARAVVERLLATSPLASVTRARITVF